MYTPGPQVWVFNIIIKVQKIRVCLIVTPCNYLLMLRHKFTFDLGEIWGLHKERVLHTNIYI